MNRYFGLAGLTLTVLLVLPFPLDMIPSIGEGIADYYESFWKQLLPKIGDYFDLEVQWFETGSGDLLYYYLKVLSSIILSFLIGLLAIKWRRLSSEKTRMWSWLLLRAFLGYSLWSYGWAKFLDGQFSEPSLFHLEKKMGEYSPMGLAWTFMGYSKTYMYFAGISEILAGTLLIFRKTTLIGAILAFGVMFNVFMMNMSFDIPVKLFSFQLLVFAFAIICYYRKQLFRFLLTHRETSGGLEFRFKRPIIVMYSLIVPMIYLMDFSEQYGYSEENASVSVPLQGVYELAANQSSTQGWQKMIIDYEQYMQVFNDEGMIPLEILVDTVAKTITYEAFTDSTLSGQIEYQNLDSVLILKFDTMRLRYLKKPFDYKLMTRGFHWINDYPYH
ncbi:MAG: DoxX family protein [Flavobacteriales bacterium]|nr:DoxX family protein [Flavobacteriales bacterium]